MFDFTNIQKLITEIRWDSNKKKKLLKATMFLSNDASLSERLYCLKENIAKIPSCPVCGKNLKFQKFGTGYQKYCSFTCMNSSPDVKRKRMLTNFNIYGGKTPAASKAVRNKMKRTMVKNLGVDNASKSEAVKKKKIDTLLKNFGVTNPSKSKAIQNKKKTTSKAKYGEDHWLKNLTNKERFSKILLKKTLIAKINSLRHVVTPMFNIDDDLDDTTLYKWKCVKCSFEFSNTVKNNYIPLCPKCTPKETLKPQKELEAFIKSIYHGSIVTNDKEAIKPKELSVFLPKEKIGIEIIGVYWCNKTSKTTNLEKTKQCLAKDIRLIQIFDIEWVTKNDIIKSKIRNILGLSKKIHAKNCTVDTISKETAYAFLTKHHIQGSINSSVYLGLFFENELVSVMTFGKPRYNKKYEWELLRFCSKINLTIVGGASKILMHFENEYSPKSLISYADVRWSTGAVYEKLGFSYLGTSSPNYYYYQANKPGSLTSRIKFQKNKLKNILPNFDPKLTEYENMLNHGYNRVWDCGNHIFIKLINK